ncbi:MAG: AraC family transcriptional regulator [Cyclobacteriaceae bacterium]
MKVFRFNVPKTNKESFWIDEYKGKYFYDKLHWHPEIQITLIKGMTGDVLAGGYYGRFYPGEIYVIGSNIPHVFRSDHPNELKQEDAVSIIFSPTLFGKTFLALPESESLNDWIEKTHYGMKISANTIIDFAAIFEKINNSWGFNRLYHLIELLFSLLNTDCVALATNPKKVYNNQETKLLDKILTYTFTNFQNTITIEDVSSLACMSSASFCRYFKSKTQKTYIQFLNEVRIANACKILMKEDTTIAQSALLSGYNNLTYFNRKFKSIMEHSPSEYLKIIKQY